MKYTTQPTSPLPHPRGLLLLVALSVCLLLLTAACGTHPSPQTNTVSLQPASPPPVPLNFPLTSAVDVREVNRALADDEMQGYVGSDACTSCHKQTGAEYSRSHHAHTFHLVSTAQDGPFFHASQALTDTHIKYAYRTGVENGQCLIVGKNARGQGKIAATYAVGTGRTGITYLGEDEHGQWLELRLSYFPKAHTWDFTPGQNEGKDLVRAAGRPLMAKEFQQCLGCHGTAIRATSEGADVPRSLMNVGCERCHGPGRSHLNQVAKALTDATAVRKPAASNEHPTYDMEDLHQASPQRITEICGGCHRSESPTHPLSPVEEPRLARFQGVALARSACYQQSGVLSCLTCHDAHGNANPSLSRNDAICLRCHTTPNTGQTPAHTGELTGHVHTPSLQTRAARIIRGKVCPINTRTGCTACHMPKTSGIMPYSLFTNHLIKVWPSNTPQLPSAQTRKQ